MAIVQISQIKHRRGVSDNLPQLASAELGWSVDTRQLYIGNGTLAEGAPEVGNTEILTEYSQLPDVAAVQSVTLADNTANSAVAGSNIAPTQLGTTINYSIERANQVRQGYLRLGHVGTTVVYDEEYTETTDLGVTLVPYDLGSNIAGLYYTTTNTGYTANLTFSISVF
jgi:hypothetical protein